ncbi:TetR/AcrR family transcriptional regulator [Sulfitobacter sp. F26204]|uniref:TetR/AcrR family transcriptional regulator n=1 Tax=Sulfitobacter sp. F26204 TaxID=2996014 RepID=UPI00225E409A|nr:TetR/AcrR family transcriptional regulator [Sulfitobacter sp. F26204]MCX7558342.1 TetR/AcrR family transcriptional regulator [Sulfitobacter sp. F26204]
MKHPPNRQRGSKKIWLDAAYEMLVCNGIEGVKVMALAQKLNLTRTGFYWFFTGLEELHAELIERWENKNTGNLVERCGMAATSICEALFNVMDCWLDPGLFDAGLDLAIRNWARMDPDLFGRLNNADQRRIDAVAALFRQHGFSAQEAETRSLTLIYTQIGYISMQVQEKRDERLERVRHYVEIFAGCAPSERDVQRFLIRHRPIGTATDDQGSYPH